MDSRRYIRGVVAIALVVFLGSATATATAAHAASTSSTSNYMGTNGGLTFSNYSVVFDTPKGASTTSYANGTAPTGWFTSQGRLYKSNGTLCSAGSTTYSNAPATGWTAAVYATCGTGYYFSQGVAGYWYGTMYMYATTNRTPNIAF